MNRVVFILLTCVCFQGIQAQIDSLRKSHKNNKIALHQITGKWLSQNTDSGYVEIFSNSYDVSIKGSISALGYAPCWPPYDGILELIDANHLKLMYYQYYWKKPAVFLLSRDLY
jgi:hypothetical protein